MGAPNLRIMAVLRGGQLDVWRSINQEQSWLSLGLNPLQAYGWVDQQNIAWRVGADFRLEKSTDEGATWVPVGTPNPASVKWGLVRLSNGRILIYGIGGDDLDMRVVYTDDEGATWTIRKPEVGWRPKHESRYQIYDSMTVPGAVFINSMSGVGPGNSRLHRSLDSGNSWERIAAGITLSTLDFFGTLFVAASGTLILHIVRQGANYSALYRSADNGSSWSLVAEPPIRSGDFNYIGFRHKIAEVAGTRRLIFMGQYYSDDDGRTWNPYAAPPTVIGSIAGGMGTTELAVFLSGGDTGFDHILRSTDGGNTWAQTALTGALRAMWGGWGLSSPRSKMRRLRH